MKLTEELYENVKEIWEGYHSHPFIKEMGEGTLPMEKFRYYMVQDYIYLYEYVKVFALGVIKADSNELMRLFSGLVNSTMNGEMDIHKSYMKRLGITEQETEETKAALDNVSYTSYMLNEAYQGGIPEILASVLACAWSYQVIGERLAEIPGMTEHEFFGEWVSGYASAEYAAANKELFEIIDRLGESLSRKQKEKMITIFIRCSLYEKNFWDMAYEMRE
ncbi:MAG: thiaminase II [Lachnospiraceae bacterium]|nr:thiaminase II [Lachnospiraceae bacterium]